MRTRFLAAIVGVSLMPASAAFAQDYSAAVAASRADQNINAQQTLHNDARDFNDLSGAVVEKAVDKYRTETAAQRQNALDIAAQARTNALPAGTGARIRDALEADLTFWYNSVPVPKREFDAMRKQWLVPVASLTDQQWAQHRADWFAARDAWLTKRVETARLVRH